jgi:hypothetical protein
VAIDIAQVLGEIPPYNADVEAEGNPVSCRRRRKRPEWARPE